MDSTAERRKGTFSFRFFFSSHFTHGDKFPVDFVCRLCLKTILMNLRLYSHHSESRMITRSHKKLASFKL